MEETNMANWATKPTKSKPLRQSTVQSTTPTSPNRSSPASSEPTKNSKNKKNKNFFSQIAVGSNHNIALTDKGTVFTWGRNDYGQLGIGNNDANKNRLFRKSNDGVVSNVVELLSLRGTPIRQIAACSNNTYFLTHSGAVFACGDYAFGKLGFDKSSQEQPRTTQDAQRVIFTVKTPPNEHILKIQPGSKHVLALTKSKKVWSWGCNKSGQLAFNDKSIEEPGFRTSQYFDSKLSGDNIIDIAAGQDHSMFLTDKHRVIIAGNIHDVPHVNEINQVRHQKVTSMFAGESRCFLITTPEDDKDTSESLLSLYDENGFVVNKEGRVCPVNIIKGNISSYKEEKALYAHSAVLNFSFLKPDHYLTNRVDNSGIDYTKLQNAMDTWAGLEDKCREENSILYMTRDLLPSLSTQPQSIEAIRVYIILPLLPHFNPKTASASSIQAEYCTSFFNLPCAARAVLRNWLANDVPKKVFQAIVRCFTVTVSKMCEEHSKTEGNIMVKTPINPSNNRSYEITDHPDPTTVVVANRAVVSMLQYLGILNFVNERRSAQEKISFEDFYLDEHVLRNWDWTDDWRRRCEERHVIGELFTKEHSKAEIVKMDTLNLAFSKRNSFKEAMGKDVNDYPKDFDVTTYGVNRHEQYFNLLSYPFCINPKSKSKVLQIETKTAQEHAHRLTYYQNIKNNKQDQPVFQLYIDRENLVESTFRNLMCSEPADFKKPLTVKFANEKARDVEADEAAGVRREFFVLILTELLSSKNQYGMFKFFDRSAYMWFSDNCFEEDAYYQLIGIICGLALYNDNIVDIHFPLALYKMLQGEEPDFEDLCMLDPVSGQGLKKLRDAPADEVELWGLTWSVDVESFDKVHTVPLCPGGEDKAVTGANREDFIQARVNHLFKNERSMKCFSELEKGFKTVVKDEMSYVLNLFKPEELMKVVVGNTSYNWEDLRQSAQYQDSYHRNHPNIKRFWQVFMAFKEEQKKQFLQFLTGSSKIPISGLQIWIQPVTGKEKNLPQAHTCFYLLDLPEYSTSEIMRSKILTAITECEGFQFI